MPHLRDKFDHRPMPEARLSARRMLSPIMIGTTVIHQREGRMNTALVYRDGSCEDRWLVRAPGLGDARERAFSGPDAREAALEFAHRIYGGARSFAN